MYRLTTYSFLFFIIFCFSCKKDVEPQQTSNQEYNDYVLDAQPMYTTPVCKKIENLKEKRMCSDRQLMTDISEAISELRNKDRTLGGSKAIVQFDIPPNGKAQAVEITRSVNAEVDKIIREFISKTRWTPAIREGEKVKITRRLPIHID